MYRAVTALAAFLISSASALAVPAPEDSRYYLFYNYNSPAMEYELGVTRNKVEKIFDDQFGVAAAEMPEVVGLEDFYIARYPDQSYVFTLKSGINCAAQGCTTYRYTLDQEGDFYFEDFSFPVKCKNYDAGVLLCIRGKYEAPADKDLSATKPKARAAAKKRTVHYYAPGSQPSR